MSETSPTVKVARDLTEIVSLTASLEDQAIHKANDRLMPGGLAMVALGDVASIDQWSEQLEAAEHQALANAELYGAPVQMPAVEEDDEDWQPPLQTLLFWSEAWRTEHGYPLTPRPTITSEANFIRWALDWAWDNEPHFDDFARDVRLARTRLENVLYAGARAVRSRVVCDRDHCDRKPRLVLVTGTTEAEDHHKCPSCKSRFDADDFMRAHAKQLRSEGAKKFVVLADAIGTLRAQGRSERTVRKWFSENRVEGYCRVDTHAVYVWWPDLWRLHLTTPSRARAS